MSTLHGKVASIIRRGGLSVLSLKKLHTDFLILLPKIINVRLNLLKLLYRILSVFLPRIFSMMS